MNIEITPKKIEGLERLLEISVPVQEVRQAEQVAATRYASRVTLPGFRPGKVPPAMVRKRYADAIRQEAIESVLQDAFKEVVAREQFKIAGQPHVDHVHFDDGKPLTFELHVELHPEISLDRTSGFRVARTSRAVAEEQVSAQIEALRGQRASWAPVEERAMPGDMVTVLLATAEEGDTLEAKEYRVVLGEGQAIPGIEELIMEIAPGETAERPVRWPDEFPDEVQRGKTKRVRVTVQDVKRKSLPELGAAFAGDVGDFESVEALAAAVRADLEGLAQRESDLEVRQRLIDEMISANTFDVPASWVAQLMKAYSEAYKIPEEELDKFAAEFRPIAERQVRRDLIVERLAEREGLKSTEADIDDRVTALAEKRGTEPGRLYATLEKAGRLTEMERSITEDKVFAWLFERNEVG